MTSILTLIIGLAIGAVAQAWRTSRKSGEPLMQILLGGPGPWKPK